MNDTEKKLSADIKVYNLAGKFLRKEVRDNFPTKKKHWAMRGRKKPKTYKGGWN